MGVVGFMWYVGSKVLIAEALKGVIGSCNGLFIVLEK